MSRNNYQIIGSAITLAASGSQIVDIYVADVDRLVLLFDVTDGSNSLISYNISDGTGLSDPTATGPIPIVLGGSAYAKVDSSGTTYASSGAKTKIYLNLSQTGPWIRVTISTTSGSTTTVQIYGDI